MYSTGIRFYPVVSGTSKPSNVIGQSNTVLQFRNRAAVIDGTIALARMGCSLLMAKGFIPILLVEELCVSTPRVRFRLLAARALWPSRRLLNKLKDKLVTGRLNVITRSKKLKQKVFKMCSAPMKPQVLPSLCNPVGTCHRACAITGSSPNGPLSSIPEWSPKRCPMFVNILFIFSISVTVPTWL